MAKKTPEQIQAIQDKAFDTVFKRRDQEDRIAEAQERQNAALDKGLKTIDLESIMKERISKIDDGRKKNLDKIAALEKDTVKARQKYFGANSAIADQIEAENKDKIKGLKVDEQNYRDAKERAFEQNELAMEYSGIIEESGDKAKQLGDGIKGFVEGLPGGKMLSKQFGIDTLGDDLQEGVVNNMIKSFDVNSGQSAMGLMKNGFKTVGKMLGPAGLIAVGLVGIFTIVKNINKMQREFANNVGISRDQVGLLAVKTKVAEKSFNAIGLDGTQIQGTLKTIVTEFGSLENMTVANAANIERFAQNAGVASSDVVKLNKAFMDLDGLSFDAATNVSKTAVGLAKAAGVSTAKVIGDMSSSAAAFARFSMEGADGFARAAVEAAKVGANLSGILEAADSLLKFETSISDQFEAQVLTGKMINTERARQLALDGDIAGLTTEIQSIVGGVGDIQSLNVIQRKSVADAIGISVSDLLKISRGEQVAATETVQDLQKRTNDILIEGLDVSREQLGITKDNKTVNINTPIT